MLYLPFLWGFFKALVGAEDFTFSSDLALVDFFCGYSFKTLLEIADSAEDRPAPAFDF